MENRFYKRLGISSLFSNQISGDDDYFGDDCVEATPSKKENIDDYLSKMGSSEYDIEEIFVEVIDIGYKLSYSTKEFDDGNIIKITISIDNDTLHEDITYLETIYHAISRFMNTYKDKTMKITYELNKKLKINCYV